MRTCPQFLLDGRIEVSALQLLGAGPGLPLSGPVGADGEVDAECDEGEQAAGDDGGAGDAPLHRSLPATPLQ